MTEPRAVLVCVNRRLDVGAPSCAGRGSERLAACLEQRLAERGLDLPVERIHCFGECQRGPNLRLAPGGRFHHGVDESDLDALLAEIESAISGRPG